MTINTLARNLKKTALVCLALAGAMMAHAETYALCIGINDYPTIKDSDGKEVDQDLKGAVNDATAYRDLFTKSYGVKNARLITDKDATVEKFIDGMKWLITSAKPGDQVLFVYSGHGAQVEDKSEPDGFEEVLVLADMQLVPGDLFNEFSKMLTVNGVNCTFIFDSCFSGGMSRDIDGKISVTNKTLGVVKPKSRNAVGAIRTKGLSIKPKQAAKPAETGQSLFLFASKESKPSSDISGIEGVPAHGLFTLILLGALEEDPKTSVREIFGFVNTFLDDINKKLKEQGADKSFDQGPEFETSSARSGLPIVLQ